MTQHHKDEPDDLAMPEGEFPKWLVEAVQDYFEDDNEEGIGSPSTTPKERGETVNAGWRMAQGAEDDDEEGIGSPSATPKERGETVNAGRRMAQGAYAMCKLREVVAKRLESGDSLDEAIRSAAREAGVDLGVVAGWICPHDPRPDAIGAALRNPECFARTSIALKVPLARALGLMRVTAGAKIQVNAGHAAAAADGDGKPDWQFSVADEAIVRACYRQDQETY